MNVYLDDMRAAPPGWLWAKNVREAQELLVTDQVDSIDLDHDLGEGEPTGYDLVKWMHETGHWPKNVPMIHSQNPVGRQNMADFVDRYGPYGGQS